MTSEASIQSAIVQFVRAVAPEVIIFAIPNAARRIAGGKAGNAVAGLTPGIPDLGLVLPDGRAAFIEVKAEKGKLSAVQSDMASLLKQKGIPFICARSIDDVRFFFRACRVSTREAA